MPTTGSMVQVSLSLSTSSLRGRKMAGRNGITKGSETRLSLITRRVTFDVNTLVLELGVFKASKSHE